jgi:hypothetical protein
MKVRAIQFSYEALFKRDSAEWLEIEKLSKKINIIVGATLEDEAGIIYKTVLKLGDEFRTFMIGKRILHA